MEKLKRKPRRPWRFLGLLALGAFPMACATTGGVPVPDAITVSRADSQWPGTTLIDLQKGRNAYAQNCASCHNLYDASHLSPIQWELIMVKMQKKAKIDDLTKDSILRYLLASTTQKDDSSN
jgi:mono/diheme cytochrome c family protein